MKTTGKFNLKEWQREYRKTDRYKELREKRRDKTKAQQAAWYQRNKARLKYARLSKD